MFFLSPDTATLISTSSLLSAVFPSVWPASANVVCVKCMCVCVCMFSAYSPLRFQGCELVSRHSTVWRLRPASHSVTERTARAADQSGDERNITSWLSHKAEMSAEGTRATQVRIGYIHLAGITISLFPVCSQICLLKLALESK